MFSSYDFTIYMLSISMTTGTRYFSCYSPTLFFFLFLFLMLSKGEINTIDAKCTGELYEEISWLRDRCWMYGGALLSLHHLLPKLLTIGLPSSKRGSM